ncbi:transcription factor [Ganoderma sinense ZZ0214-1]|uniref:Transcription factor n=1 Tax=Ganoderma sinense ZZ0214-1 TaxID=1077348 RepID=A0A2G8RMY7_9APHY|nr:transcription factor [Ganoderma sinense ZZ0214-1]
MSAYHPRPKVSCVRCNKNHDTPAAFLMACAKCERAWHHTCHIPQVSEEEILERITFDNQGKREAGLAGWQCKRCTKRARVEQPPAAAPDQPVGVSALSAASKPRPQSLKPFLNRHSNSSVRTTSSAPPQANFSATTQITVADDDDIIMLDDVPEQSHRSVADLGSKPHVDVAQTVTAQQLPSKSLSPQPTPAAASEAPSKPHKTVKMSKTAQKRPAKSHLIITPLPGSRELPVKEPLAGPSTQVNHTLRPLSPSPPLPPPEAQPEQARSRTRSPTPIPPPQPIQPEPTIQHISFSAPTSANVKTISTSDIRALISTMRSEGRLAPPPEVEYVHTRPRDGPGPLSNPRPRRSGARKLAYTHAPELDDDTDDDAAMEVDRSSIPPPHDSDPDTRRGDEEEDPHNIDDLYGDIAPRYRRSKTAAPRPPPSPPPMVTRRLRVESDKRPLKEDDLGLLVDKKLRLEAAPGPVRAPMKASATHRLRGKALQEKQETGLYFSFHEERRRAAGG